MVSGNWLNPDPQLSLSLSFQTSNSGAFRSLHCLIYKVLVPLRSRSRNIHYSSTLFQICQALFRLFSQSFLCSPCRFRAARRLCYLTTFPRTCQALFSTFLKFFRSQLRSPGLFHKAWLSYHTSFPLSSPFFISWKLFSLASGKPPSVSDSLTNIPDPSPPVNTFS